MTDPESSARTPTQVALYANAEDPPKRVAVFRWSEPDGVRLEILDDEWGEIAQEYFEHGIELYGAERMVTGAEGALFMRALLQPFRLSYYTFRNESNDS